jgi:hypothetical protein
MIRRGVLAGGQWLGAICAVGVRAEQLGTGPTTGQCPNRFARFTFFTGGKDTDTGVEGPCSGGVVLQMEMEG